MAYEKLLRPTEALALTFLAVQDNKKKGHFYFEIYTEPEEGPRKNTSAFTGPGDRSLSERVEVNWHGDEDALVISVVEYTGTQVGGHKPIGEVRLSSQECMDIVRKKEGTVKLSLGSHDEIELKRKLAMRKIHPESNPQAIIVKQAIESMQEVSFQKFGEEYPNPDIMNDLRKENAALRKKLGADAAAVPVTKTKKSFAPQKSCDVVIQFTIETKELVDHKKFSTIESMQSKTFTPVSQSA